jgi:RimJ/RimL family protein N-acetyltransferase
MMIETERLRLRPWEARDRDAFAALHADPEVMWDYGGPLDRAKSDAKFDRYRRVFAAQGLSRWVMEDRQGAFLGYTGLMPSGPDHPLGAHVDVGWRLMRAAWGHGYAQEAARACLAYGFRERGLAEILAYAGPENLRSQTVMARLGLVRDPARDFTMWHAEIGDWHAQTWVARR